MFYGKVLAMKRTASLLLVSFLLVSQTGLFAAEMAAPGTPVRKLQRGFLNAVLSPFEISNEMDKEKKNETIPPSWFLGLGRGMIYSVGRSLVGIYEILTFPFSPPGDYGPVLQPEFPWEHVPDQPAKKQ